MPSRVVHTTSLSPELYLSEYSRVVPAADTGRSVVNIKVSSRITAIKLLLNLFISFSVKRLIY